jgi:hypothetical protein
MRVPATLSSRASPKTSPAGALDLPRVDQRRGCRRGPRQAERCAALWSWAPVSAVLTSSARTTIAPTSPSMQAVDRETVHSSPRTGLVATPHQDLELAPREAAVTADLHRRQQAPGAVFAHSPGRELEERRDLVDGQHVLSNGGPPSRMTAVDVHSRRLRRTRWAVIPNRTSVSTARARPDLRVRVPAGPHGHFRAGGSRVSLAAHTRPTAA